MANRRLVSDLSWLKKHTLHNLLNAQPCHSTWRLMRMALLRRLSVCTTSVNRKTARKRISVIVLASGVATAQTDRLQLGMECRISRQRFSRFLSATPGKFRDSIPTTQWLLPAHCSTSSYHSALYSDVRHFKSRNFRHAVSKKIEK